MFTGTAVHNKADDLLRELHGDRFIYSSNNGPDFLDTTTGKHIEVTTPGQVSRHKAKGPEYENAEYVTYDLPR